MKRRGFTLIEILAVIVILGIVAMIAIPVVSSYISNTRNKTFEAHETNMIEAAKSFMIECIDGKENCTLPTERNASEIYLSELIDKGFSEKLQDPQGDGYCSESLSYVRVINKGNSKFEYHSCLYCGNYVTEDDGCVEINATDLGNPPVCGTIEGVSSEWTNKPRTITVGCTDPDNNCKYERFPKTYKTTTVTDKIAIYDLKGNSTQCDVDVNVDTTPPSCEIAKVSGNEEDQTNWLSGNVVFSIQNQSDANSGILTYGMGTRRTPDYNRKTSISLQDVSGLVTVLGYVKDNAGNEAVCSKTVRVGVEKPDFDIYYGYQILPTKEHYSITGATISNDEKNITMNGANAKLTFSNMNKYDNVKRAVIVLSNYVSNGTTYSLKYGTKTVSGQVNEGTNRIVFEMDKGTYETYEFTLGDRAGTLNINRIELEKEKGTTYNTYTSKNITVNLVPNLATEKVKTTEFSFDNGAHYQAAYYKEYSSSSNGNAKTKNIIGMISDTKVFNLTNFDKTAPTVDNITGDNTTEYVNNKITLSTGAIDSESGLVKYAWSNNANLPYNSSEWKDIPNAPSKTKFNSTHDIDRNQTVYFYAKDEAGNVTKKSFVVAVIDYDAPTCTSSASITGWTNQDVTVTGNCDDGDGSGCVQNSSVKVSTNTNGDVNPGRVCDRAGNCVDCPSATVKIDKDPPTCDTTKSNLNTTSGVSATFKCDNNSGGSITTCANSVSGIKATTNYNIRDEAGNTGKCTVSVSSKRQKRTKSCSAGNTCSNTAFGTQDCNCGTCNGTTCVEWKNGTCKTWNTECKEYEQVCVRYELTCDLRCRCHDSTGRRPDDLIHHYVHYSNSTTNTCDSAASHMCMGRCLSYGYTTGTSLYAITRTSRCTQTGNGACKNLVNTTCAEYNKVCNKYNQVSCNCQQCPKSGTDAAVCGCKTWGSFGSWSDDSSCTSTSAVESSDHSTIKECRLIYY